MTPNKIDAAQLIAALSSSGSVNGSSLYKTASILSRNHIDAPAPMPNMMECLGLVASIRYNNPTPRLIPKIVSIGIANR